MKKQKQEQWKVEFQRRAESVVRAGFAIGLERARRLPNATLLNVMVSYHSSEVRIHICVAELDGDRFNTRVFRLSELPEREPQQWLERVVGAMEDAAESDDESRRIAREEREVVFE